MVDGDFLSGSGSLQKKSQKITKIIQRAYLNYLCVIETMLYDHHIISETNNSTYDTIS